MHTVQESQIFALYRRLLDAWNYRDPVGMAACFCADGELIGYDGSELRGAAKITDELRRIFADHPTGFYVTTVRGIELLSRDIALLRAVAAIVPPGQDELDPQTEMIVRMLAAREPSGWRVVLLHNTPTCAREPL